MDKLSRSIAADLLKDAGFEEEANLISPMVMNEDWRHAIKCAADRNIMVLDYDAITGKLTRRLVSLMKTVHGRSCNGDSKLTHLLAPMEAFMSLLIEMNINAETDNVSLFGVYIQGSYDFSFGDHGDYNHYFLEECGGTLPSNKEEIVIGMAAGEKDETKRYLLGAI